MARKRVSKRFTNPGSLQTWKDGGRPLKGETIEEYRFMAGEEQRKHLNRKNGTAYEGLSFELHGALKDLAEDRCMICGQEPNGKGLEPEHDHESGKVRGMVCYRCNTILGWAKDDPEILERAAEYLRLTKDGYQGLTRYFLDARPTSVTNPSR